MVATDKPAREVTRIYEPFDEDLPADYREAVLRILQVQARIETEYPGKPELTLVPAMKMAPNPDEWVRYASYWAQEVEHASYWIKMLDDLGFTVDDAFMATPKPIYIFDMRDEAQSWADWAFFSFFADRQGAYMAWEWIDSSYGPFNRIAERTWREEEGHAQMGFEMLQGICSTPEGKAHAQERLIVWYPAALDMFGRSDSKRQYEFIRMGLRRRTNEEMRQEFKEEIDQVLRKVGLEPPDPLANRRYL